MHAAVKSFSDGPQIGGWCWLFVLGMQVAVMSKVVPPTLEALSPEAPTTEAPTQRRLLEGTVNGSAYYGGTHSRGAYIGGTVNGGAYHGGTHTEAPALEALPRWRRLRRHPHEAPTLEALSRRRLLWSHPHRGAYTGGTVIRGAYYTHTEAPTLEAPSQRRRLLRWHPQQRRLHWRHCQRRRLLRRHPPRGAGIGGTVSGRRLLGGTHSRGAYLEALSRKRLLRRRPHRGAYIGGTVNGAPTTEAPTQRRRHGGTHNRGAVNGGPLGSDTEAPSQRHLTSEASYTGAASHLVCLGPPGSLPVDLRSECPWAVLKPHPALPCRSGCNDAWALLGDSPGGLASECFWPC